MVYNAGFTLEKAAVCDNVIALLDSKHFQEYTLGPEGFWLRSTSLECRAKAAFDEAENRLYTVKDGALPVKAFVQAFKESKHPISFMIMTLFVDNATMGKVGYTATQEDENDPLRISVAVHENGSVYEMRIEHPRIYLEGMTGKKARIVKDIQSRWYDILDGEVKSFPSPPNRITRNESLF